MTISPKPSNSETNQRAIELVIAEIEQRGGHTQIVRDGRQVEVVAVGTVPGRAVRIQVKARTAGDWQTSTDRGCEREPESSPSRFWVLADLPPTGPIFYVVPEWWMQNDIYKNHHEYIDPRGGHRILNDDSVHHKIQTWRVDEWRDRWDKLKIFVD